MPKWLNEKARATTVRRRSLRWAERYYRNAGFSAVLNDVQKKLQSIKCSYYTDVFRVIMNLSSPFPNLFNTKQLSSAEVRESCLLTFKLISTPGFIGMSFYIQHERRYERNAPCVFSDSIITNTVKFTHIMGTSFTKLRLCCP